MNRTPGNEPSNPISRAFSKFFERGRVGAKAESAPRATPPSPAQRSAPRAQAGAPSATPQRPAPQAGTQQARPAASPAAQSRAGRVQSGTPAPATPRTYTVATGDSLSKIAQRVYGRADRWTLIFEANRDKISDPDRIYPGQVLVLPDTQSMH